MHRLFARKFDPKDTDIFQVLDKVRDGEQPWRQGPTFDYVAIQSVTAQDGEGDAGSGQEMCISLPEPSKKMGKRGGSMGSVVTMEKCDEDDARQVFKLGPCSKCRLFAPLRCSVSALGMHNPTTSFSNCSNFSWGVL